MNDLGIVGKDSWLVVTSCTFTADRDPVIIACDAHGDSPCLYRKYEVFVLFSLLMSITNQSTKRFSNQLSLLFFLPRSLVREH